MKKASAQSIAARKRAMQAEKLKKAEDRAYQRAFKQAAIQAAKEKGRADAMKQAGMNRRQR